MSCLPQRFPRTPTARPFPLLGAAAACHLFVCIGALLSCPVGVGSCSCLDLLLPTAVPFAFTFSDPLLGVPDGNDTNNQPTQGPRHYDTLNTKLFYAKLLSQDLKDERAALPVNEEVAEG